MAELPTTDGSRWETTVLTDYDIPLTGVFEPVGIKIFTRGMRSILVWCEFDFQDSTAIEMCVDARQENNGKAFPIPHQYTIEKGKILLERLCYRIEDTSFIDIPISCKIGDLTQLIQLNFRAEGGPPGAILKKVSYTMRA